MDRNWESSIRLSNCFAQVPGNVVTNSTLHGCGNATGAGENGEMRNRWTNSERSFEV
jgi:hypothetical protein